MGTPNFQTRITTRVKGVAPKLRYIAFYHRDEDRLNACMHGYEGRSFVYILTGNYNGQEHFLYVGMTKAQYARSLMHAKKFAYDNIYLFECEPEHLLACERAVIAELCPLYNRSLNPRADQYRRFLGIDYEAVQDADTIRKHLALLTEYEKKGLFGFSLSAQVFSALEEEAAEQGASCSEYLQEILERKLGERVAEKLRDESAVLEETNLITAKEYGKQYKKSREQIKAYLLQHGRIPGTAKIGRDWVIPRDAKFPQDMRDSASHS